MARPQQNTVSYFPFYVEDGKKMAYIEHRYGNDGFTVLFKILRELARTEYHYLILSDKVSLLHLTARCNVDKNKLLDIINDLVEVGKFDEELWQNYRIIWCESFIESIQDAYKRRRIFRAVEDPCKPITIGTGLKRHAAHFSITLEPKKLTASRRYSPVIVHLIIKIIRVPQIGRGFNIRVREKARCELRDSFRNAPLFPNVHVILHGIVDPLIDMNHVFRLTQRNRLRTSLRP